MVKNKNIVCWSPERELKFWKGMPKGLKSLIIRFKDKNSDHYRIKYVCYNEEAYLAIIDLFKVHHLTKDLYWYLVPSSDHRAFPNSIVILANLK